MPDGTRGLAPPSSALSLRVARLKKLSAAARKGATARRRFSELRLAEAERLLHAIIDGGDVLGEITLDDGYCPEQGMALCVTMSLYAFRKLCQLGAELEDAEDSHDAEETDADIGEPTLGWRNGHLGQLGEGCGEDEPSLGSTGMADQRRWAGGHHDGDLERDPSEREPSLGAPETIVYSFDAVHGDQERWATGGTLDLESGREDDEPSLASGGGSPQPDDVDLEHDVPPPPETLAAARARFQARMAREAGR